MARTIEQIKAINERLTKKIENGSFVLPILYDGRSKKKTTCVHNRPPRHLIIKQTSREDFAANQTFQNRKYGQEKQCSIYDRGKIYRPFGELGYVPDVATLGEIYGHEHIAGSGDRT